MARAARGETVLPVRLAVQLSAGSDRLTGVSLIRLEPARGSAQLERFAVRALLLGRIHLMGAHTDAVQRAVLRILAVVCTLLYRTADALVCMTFVHHNRCPPLVWFTYSMPAGLNFMRFPAPNLPIVRRMHVVPDQENHSICSA